MDKEFTKHLKQKEQDAGCITYRGCIMGPFGLTTISIGALSPRVLTVICPLGAAIDGSWYFMAQCVTWFGS